MVTRAACTNRPNSREAGGPSKMASVALLRSEAKTTQGPIDQPREVGQQTTSRSRLCVCEYGRGIGYRIVRFRWIWFFEVLRMCVE